MNPAVIAAWVVTALCVALIASVAIAVRKERWKTAAFAAWRERMRHVDNVGGVPLRSLWQPPAWPVRCEGIDASRCPAYRADWRWGEWDRCGCPDDPHDQAACDILGITSDAEFCERIEEVDRVAEERRARVRSNVCAAGRVR